MTTLRSELWAGIRAEIPVALGVIPFALIFGVLASGAGLPPFLAWSTSPIIFAGSAQFLAIPLIAGGSPAVILIATTFIINLRHMLYSATLAPDTQHLSTSWKWLLAYLLTDEAFATTAVHYADPSIPRQHKHWFWLGAGLTLWCTWQTFTGLGIFLGSQLPTDLGLEFTLALTFIGIVIPTLINRPMIGAAGAAGIVALLTAGLPYKLGLIAAAFTGITVGLILEQLTTHTRTTTVCAKETTCPTTQSINKKLS